MKNHVFLILVSILLLVNFPQISAAPGDRVAEAFTARFGEQQGTLDAYNDVEYYNFTGNKFQYYNFTLVEDPANFNTIGIFDSNFNKIGENFTGLGPKSVILAGYVNYTIAIYASEFMELIPGNYSLIISEVEIEVALGTAEPISSGNKNGTFELYNDVDVYNFSGSVDRLYNFQVTHNTSYTGLYVYNSDSIVLEWSWGLGEGNSINRTGNDIYLIAVVSSEFAILPLDYTLTITDITPDDTTSSSTTITSETLSSTSSTDTKSSTSSSTSSSSSPLPFQIYWVYFALAIIPLVIRKLNLKD